MINGYLSIEAEARVDEKEGLSDGIDPLSFGRLSGRVSFEFHPDAQAQVGGDNAKGHPGS